MKYILIYILYALPSGGSIEFNNIEACRYAGKQIMTLQGHSQKKFICLPKGKVDTFPKYSPPTSF